MDIGSVFIYLFVFFCSIALSRCASSAKRHRKKSSERILLFFSMLLPCILAGMRDISVGIDVQNYVVSNFKVAQSSGIDFTKFLDVMPKDVEMLFALLIYVCAKLGTISLLLFAIQFLISIPIYKVLYEKNSVSYALPLSIYYFLFFNLELSAMRQGIASSFLLLAYVRYRNKRYSSGVILAVCACLFHISAIIALSIFLVFLLISKARHPWRIYLFCVVLICGFCIALPKLSPYISSLVGLISGRYAYYVRTYLNGAFNSSNLYTVDLICKTALLLVAFFWTKIKRKTFIKYVEYDWLLAIVLMGRFWALFNGYFYESMRMAIYFDLFLILYAQEAYGNLHKTENRCLAGITMFVPVMLYWFIFIMLIGAYGTNVYSVI